MVELAGHGEAGHLQHRLLGLGGGLVHGELHVPAHHHAAELLLGGAGDVHGADVLALAQHAASVADLHDLVELVGDEEDGLALGGQTLHDLHQLVDLLGREHGGGLVEDEDLVVPVEHFEDLRALLHTHGDILHQRVRVHQQPVLLREGHHLFSGLLLLQEAQLVGLHAQDDVVQHGKALHQLEVLVDHADVERVGVVGVADLHPLPVDADLPLLRLVQAEEHAHEGGLPGPVLPQQGVDLPPLQLQGDVVVGHDARKYLGDVQHLHYVVVSQSCVSPFPSPLCQRITIIIYDFLRACKGFCPKMTNPAGGGMENFMEFCKAGRAENCPGGDGDLILTEGGAYGIMTQTLLIF